MRRRVESWIKAHDQPFLLYFHVWELDPNQPRIQAAPWRERVRQYRNLAKMEDIVRFYLGQYRFSGIGEHLGLDQSGMVRQLEPQVPPTANVPDAQEVVLAGSYTPDRAVPVTVVVPCFNEELILPYLSNTLKNVEGELGSDFDFRFLFVDDGSSDGTWKALEEIFGEKANCTWSATR